MLFTVHLYLFIYSHIFTLIRNLFCRMRVTFLNRKENINTSELIGSNLVALSMHEFHPTGL